MTGNTPFRTLTDPVLFRNQHTPQGMAFVFLSEDGQPQTISNEQFYQNMESCAVGLAAKGIRQGEIVLLALDHGFDLVSCFWGAMYRGAIPSVMTYWRPGSDAHVYAEKIKRLASAVQARAVITLQDLYSPLQSALDNLDCPVFTFQDVIKTSPDANVFLPEPDEDQTALLQFTSGTTGAPKAVVFSHRVVLEHVTASAQAYQMSRDSVYVSWLPFYHDMGLIGHIRALVCGGRLVLMSPQTWLKHPEMLLQAVHRYRGTMANMPNFSFDYCAQRIRDNDLAGVDLSSWQVLSNGSEQVMPSSMRRFSKRFGRYGFRAEALAVGYGMAENVMGISATPPGRGLNVEWISIEKLHSQNRAVPVEAGAPGAREIVSCGYPYQGVDLKILDDHGNILSEREVGEIAIRSNTLFTGYYLNPSAGKDIFWQGWFRTGDVGYIADGQLYVCDRKKDLIIVGGRNVHPQAIENIAAGVFGKSISRCAAFGLSDSHLGTEVPILIIEKRAALDESEEKQLIRRVRQQVSDELEVSVADVRMVPKGWLIKTTSGKVARTANKKKYLAEGYDHQTEEPVIDPDKLTPEQLRQILVHLFEKVLGTRGIGPHDDFIKSGGDSLSALRLFVEIEERFNQEVSVAEFIKEPTVEHMTQILSRQMNKKATAGAGRFNRRRIKQRLQHDLKSFFSIFSRKRLRIIKKQFRQRVANIFYFLAWRRLYRQKPIPKVFHLKKIRLMQRFYASLENPLQSETDVIQYGLISAAPQRRISKQTVSFSCWPGHWTLQADMTTLKQAYQEGKGVIIVGKHSRPWINRLVKELVFEKVKPGRYSSIGHIQSLVSEEAKSSSSEEIRRLKLSLFLNQLMRCQDVLKQKGIVTILPDGQGGLSSGVAVPFHGRIHTFRTGFAELAMKTGAAIIPFSVKMDFEKKRITVSFLQPLDTGSDGLKHAQRIKGLVEQYAVFLKREWTSCPGLVSFREMERHLDLPPAEKIG